MVMYFQIVAQSKKSLESLKKIPFQIQKSFIKNLIACIIILVLTVKNNQDQNS